MKRPVPQVISCNSMMTTYSTTCNTGQNLSCLKAGKDYEDMHQTLEGFIFLCY